MTSPQTREVVIGSLVDVQLCWKLGIGVDCNFVGDVIGVLDRLAGGGGGTLHHGKRRIWRDGLYRGLKSRKPVGCCHPDRSIDRFNDLQFNGLDWIFLCRRVKPPNRPKHSTGLFFFFFFFSVFFLFLQCATVGLVSPPSAFTPGKQPQPPRALLINMRLGSCA